MRRREGRGSGRTPLTGAANCFSFLQRGYTGERILRWGTGTGKGKGVFFSLHVHRSSCSVDRAMVSEPTMDYQILLGKFFSLAVLGLFSRRYMKFLYGSEIKRLCRT